MNNMNVQAIKQNIENYVKKNNLTINSFLSKNGFTSSSNYSRMLKDETFKLDFIEKIADILEISIDELIGRNTKFKSSDTSEKTNQMISENEIENKYKKLLSQKDEMIADKHKIITLLELQLENEKSKKHVNGR
jgi:transcriptional regulator with XRE-family HTH domain